MDLPSSTFDSRRLGDARLRAIVAERDYLEQFVRRIARNADADDIVQDVMLAACRSAGAFRGDGSLRGWLRRIAHNKVINRAVASARRRQREIDAASVHPVPAAGPFELIAAHQAADRVRAALRSMPTPWWNTLLARRERGETLQAIADRASVSIGTVHRWERLALERLRVAVTPDDAGDS